MIRDDIVKMAREAGLGNTGVRGNFIFFQPGTDGLERFTALVAEVEREACARAVEAVAADAGNEFAAFADREPLEVLRRAAAAIRARATAR